MLENKLSDLQSYPNYLLLPLINKVNFIIAVYYKVQFNIKFYLLTTMENHGTVKCLLQQRVRLLLGLLVSFSINYTTFAPFSPFPLCMYGNSSFNVEQRKWDIYMYVPIHNVLRNEAQSSYFLLFCLHKLQGTVTYSHALFPDLFF